ncbi:hypothetical protein ACS0PU_006778 [Formica fusca]
MESCRIAESQHPPSSSMEIPCAMIGRAASMRRNSISRGRTGCDVAAMLSRSFRPERGERISTIAWRLKCLQFRHSRREVRCSRICIPKLSWLSKDLSIDLARSTSADRRSFTLYSPHY